jgi:hypothetical protein
MRTIHNRVIGAMAALICVGLNTNAHAIPIKIDFTGSVFSAYRGNTNGQFVQDTSFLGLSVVGSFLVETDGLTRSTADSPQYTGLSFRDLPASPDWITSSLTIGDIAYDASSHPWNTGEIRYIDSKGPIPCPGVPNCSSGTPDQLSISDGSTQVLIGTGLPFPGPGSYNSKNFQLGSVAWADPQIPGSGMDYIDLADNLDALSILSLPLQTSIYRGVTGSYGESVLTCTTTSCRQTQALSLAFDVTSVSRNVLAVPEPHSIAVFCFGLLVLSSSRIRRRSERQSFD